NDPWYLLVQAGILDLRNSTDYTQLRDLDHSPHELCSLDRFPVKPRSNTVMVSKPDEDRQLAYVQIRSFFIRCKTHECTAHMATPGDPMRIDVLKALCSDGTEDAEFILLSCKKHNPQWQKLAARRMGKSRPLRVAFFYFCIDRIEACVNCRQTGHRADVCPMPPQGRCHCSGAQHPSPNENGSHYDWQSLPAPAEPEKKPRRYCKSRSRDCDSKQPRSRERSHSVPFPPLEGRDRSASKNRSVSKNRKPKEDRTAWATVATAGAESALIMELRRQNSNLELQLMQAFVSKPTTSAQNKLLWPSRHPPPTSRIHRLPANVTCIRSTGTGATWTEIDIEIDDGTCRVVSSATVLTFEQRLEAHGLLSPQLRAVSVPVKTSTPICDTASLFRYDPTTQFCAGSLEKDACKGDSGGTALQKEGDSSVLVGVISFGENCGVDPGIYVRPDFLSCLFCLNEKKINRRKPVAKDIRLALTSIELCATRKREAHFVLGQRDMERNETLFDNKEDANDVVWILTSSFLIFTMQSGYGLLESGFVSRKNEVNILVKNATTVLFGGLVFWAFGYGIGFDDMKNPYFSFGEFFTSADESHMGQRYSRFVFQLAYATTSTTLVSGAMAERTKFTAYCLFSVLNTAMYCVPAGWIWNPGGFLARMGAVDIGGSGVVHLLGGCVGLVSAIVLGPRLGRYDLGTAPLPLGNPTNALLGLFMLWYVQAAGVQPLLVLIAIPILDRLRVDDPTETFASHGICGLWGLLAIGLFPERDHLLDYTRGRSGLFVGGGWDLLVIQSVTAGCIIAWAILMSAVLLVIIKYTVGLRMSPEQEILGPDLVDHEIEHDYNSPFLQALQQHYFDVEKTKTRETKVDIFKRERH
ncbi:ammonium transporter, putative, partial [Ixodes scapularis]